MRSPYLKTAACFMLAALMVPAVASASVDACIAACSGGYMPDDAECMAASAERHPVTVSGGCCSEKPSHAGTSATVGHSESGCSCPTCSLAPSRFFTDRAPVKLPPVAKMLAPTAVILAPATVPFVRADEARSAQIRTTPTRAQLCVYLR